MLWAFATGDILVVSLGWPRIAPGLLFYSKLHIWTKFCNLSLSAFNLQAGNFFSHLSSRSSQFGFIYREKSQFINFVSSLA